MDMTIRKQMMIIIIIILFFTITFNSLLSGQFIDRYFKGFVEGQYEDDVLAIENYAENILLGDVDNFIQADIELNNYLSDVIVGIEVLNASNQLIIAVESDNDHMSHMMRNRISTEEIIYTIKQSDQVIGYVRIEKILLIGSSEDASLFLISMMRSIAISGVLTLLLSFFVIGFVTKRMTRDLRNTEKMAKTIDSNMHLSYKKSKIKEVKAIQTTLLDLAIKLKMKEGIRKEKADRLAHEARTPLTILKSNLEGVLDGVVETDEERYRLWLNEVERLTHLIENIGDIIDFEKEDNKASFTEFNLVDIVKKVTQSMQPQFKVKGITLDFYTDNKDYAIHSDENIISKSLYNLLSNAFKFTPENGYVTVEIAEINQHITITVCDSGLGLAEDEIKDIFNAYFRGSNSNHIEGIGMGLYIVKESLEAIEGTITAKKNVDQGMTFEITL
jgi:signal transduction histidine kinase